MGNFALSLKDGGNIDVIKINDNTFRVDIYNSKGQREIDVEVNSDIFVEWVLDGVSG